MSPKDDYNQQHDEQLQPHSGHEPLLPGIYFGERDQLKSDYKVYYLTAIKCTI